MPQKNVLVPRVLAAAQSLSANFTSSPTLIPYLDNVAYQINVTTSDSTGTFTVQGSLDYNPAQPLTGPLVAGNWVTLTLSANPTVSASNDTILINLNQVPYNALRVSYAANTAGTGTCKIMIMCKGLS